MSKIGRRLIKITSAKITVDGKKITIDGPKGKFLHELSNEVKAVLENDTLRLGIENDTRRSRMMWGLNRALLANKIEGVEKGFERKITIVGLGYKAVISGKKIVFTLGYTNKIEYEIPEGVIVEVDKSGQKLVVKSADKFLLGNVCDTIRSFRKPEPYKGTGIIRENDIIIRKAGKTKST